MSFDNCCDLCILSTVMSALKCHNFIPFHVNLLMLLCPIIGTSSSSEDPDEMQPYATFLQVLLWLKPYFVSEMVCKVPPAVVTLPHIMKNGPK